MAKGRGRPPKVENFVAEWAEKIHGEWDLEITKKLVEELIFNVLDKIVDTCPLCSVSIMKDASECPVCSRPIRKRAS